MHDTAALIDRLNEHQARIERLLARGEGNLRGESIDPLALGRGRWELARMLVAYQHFKHRELFDRLIAQGTPRQMVRARRMKLACTAFGTEFRDYLLRWGSADILDDWARYRPAAIEMTTRIRAHLASERREAVLLVAEGRQAA